MKSIPRPRQDAFKRRMANNLITATWPYPPWCHSDPWAHPPRDSETRRYPADRDTCPEVCTCIRTQPDWDKRTQYIHKIGLEIFLEVIKRQTNLKTNPRKVGNGCSLLLCFRRESCWRESVSFGRKEIHSGTNLQVCSDDERKQRSLVPYQWVSYLGWGGGGRPYLSHDLLQEVHTTMSKWGGEGVVTSSLTVCY